MLNPDPKESPSITRSIGHLAGTIIRRVGISDLLNETYEAAFLPDPPQPAERPKSSFQIMVETLAPVLIELLKNSAIKEPWATPGTTYPSAVPATAPPFTKYQDDCAPACPAPCASACAPSPDPAWMEAANRMALTNARLSGLIDEALRHLGVDPASSCDPDTLRTMLPDAVRKVVEERDAARANAPPSNP